MTAPPDDVFDTVRRDLASWHATHPDATFADMEAAVEAQIAHVRAVLLKEHTGGTYEERHPLCAQCGTIMQPRARTPRTMVLPGEETVRLERTHVVCPACGARLFPPG